MAAAASTDSAATGGGAVGDKWEDAGFATRVIHVGQAPDPVSGAVCPPISLATTFAQSSPGVASGKESGLSYHKGYEYSRTNNPTRAAFEQAIASAEGGKHGLAFASGLAATMTAIHLLNTGDHVICIDDVYGGTQRYFRRIASASSGQTFDFMDMSSTEALEKAITDNPKTKMVWIETPTNPTLKITDIRAVAEVTKRHDVLLVVDNTFMSPYFQNPLELGADIVMHSCTKYINGHSDVVMGVLITSRDDLNERLRYLQNGIGAIPSPFDSYMALRGLKTLHLRMERHAANALEVARFLESRTDIVDKVVYPGLESHPQYEIARTQMKGAGGMITFYLKGDLAVARAFLENLKVFTLAESLGAVESLAESPAIMTHASVPADVRAKLGISDSLVRLSVGIEDAKDILADVETALAAAAAALK